MNRTRALENVGKNLSERQWNVLIDLSRLGTGQQAPDKATARTLAGLFLYGLVDIDGANYWYVTERGEDVIAAVDSEEVGL